MRKVVFLMLGLIVLFLAAIVLIPSCIDKGKVTVAPVSADSIPGTTDSAIKSVEWICTTKEWVETTKKAAGLPSKFFPNGSVLKYKFDGGTAANKATMYKVFNDISAVANLTFQESATGPYDGIIGFTVGAGAWSNLGLDARSKAAQGIKTMNVDASWISYSTALHEACHWVGMIHEASSPNSNICLNKPAIEAYLKGPPNYFTQQEIEYNVYYKYSASQATATIYDLTSIEHYSFPASWVCSGIAIPGGSVLSALDKLYLSTIYPGKVAPPTTNITLSPAQVNLLMANATSARDIANKAALDAQATLNTALAAKASATNNFNALKIALGQ